MSYGEVKNEECSTLNKKWYGKIFKNKDYVGVRGRAITIPYSPMKTKINTHRKNVILDVLRGGGGVSNSDANVWNGDIVMDIFLLMRSEYNLRQEDVRMVDPTLLSLVVDGNEGDSNHVKNIKTMRDIVNTTSLLLVPVFHRGNWSLMTYVRDWKKWYICAVNGGNGGGDMLRIMEIIHTFHKLGVVVVKPKTTIVRTYDNLPEPDRGIHCLYYAFIHIHNYNLLVSGGIEEFEREVSLMIRPEKEIPSFIECVKKLISV